MQASIDFYQALGFKQFHSWQADDASLQITHLKLEQITLELFCYHNNKPAPDHSHTIETDLHHIGVKHFGLQTTDIQKTKSQLEQQGLANNIQIQHGRTGIDYFFIKDPNGILLEIVQDDRAKHEQSPSANLP